MPYYFSILQFSFIFTIISYISYGKKKCNKCNKVKFLKNFYKRKDNLDGYRNDCKECVRKRANNYYKEKINGKFEEEKTEKTKEKKKHVGQKKCVGCEKWKNKKEFFKSNKNKDNLRGYCIECFKLKDKEYRKNNKEKIKAKRKKYYLKHKEKITEYRKEYKKRQNVIKREKKYHKNYRSKNKERINCYRKIYEKNRYNYDIFFKLKKNISRSLLQYLKKKKNNQKSEHIINQKFKVIKQHLEEQFIKDINWDNYGNYWVIDHIIPQSLYKNKEEYLEKCWNLRNLRPLEKLKNIKKSNKIDLELVESYGIKDLLPNKIVCQT